MFSKNSQIKKVKGFTLIELSIVLVVIALLVAAIIGGDKIVRLANLSRARMLTNSSPVIGMESLVLWLEATSKKSFNNRTPGKGERISTWYDINPQLNIKHSATQLTVSAQPTYVEDAIRGLPAIRFDGVNDSLISGKISDWKFFQQAKDHTYFIVFKTFSSNPNNFQLPLSTSLADLISGRGMDFVIEDRASQGRNQQVWGTVSSSGTAVYEVTTPNDGVNLTRANMAGVTYKYGRTGNDARLYVNGVLAVSLEGNGAAGSSVNSNSTLYIGADYQNSYPFNGYIAEVLVFNELLSDAELNDVQTYLSKKWKLN